MSEACQRQAIEQLVIGSPKILGVDVARFGDDRSVIIRRQGLVAFAPMVLSSIDNMTLAGKVAAEMKAWQPDAVFIDAGRGEGVIDRLRQLGFSVIEVNFGSKALVDAYANKRAEMWDAMAKWLRSGGCLPNHPQLKTDLCSQRTVYPLTRWSSNPRTTSKSVASTRPTLRMLWHSPSPCRWLLNRPRSTREGGIDPIGTRWRTNYRRAAQRLGFDANRWGL